MYLYKYILNQVNCQCYAHLLRCISGEVYMNKTIKIVLDNKLTEKNITRYQLSKITAIKYQTIDNYYKNKVVRYDRDIILKICVALECEVGDIIKII